MIQQWATRRPVSRAAAHHPAKYPGPTRRDRPYLVAAMAASPSSSPAAADGSVPAVVSPQWLAERLREQPGSVRVLDASWYLPAMGRDAAAEFRAARIPGARFFDTDGIALASTDLPHMLPPERAFAAAMDALGVGNTNSGAAAAAADEAKTVPLPLPSHVVAYDGFGTFASPRLWWALRAMGHERVSVLSGGLPAWRAAGLPVEEAGDARDDDAAPLDGGAAAAARAVQEQEKSGGAAAAAAAQPTTAYRASLRSNAAWSFDQMLAAASGSGGGKGASSVAEPPPLLLDARPAGRFRGAEPEPRAHLRRGHMPGALNVPFAALLEGGEGGSGLSGARLKSPEALRAAFAEAGVDLEEVMVGGGGGGADPAVPARQVVCSCGSGLTACIVALGLHEATGGKVDAAVYDGSWCEWGARDDAPIVSAP